MRGAMVHTPHKVLLNITKVPSFIIIPYTPYSGSVIASLLERRCMLTGEGLLYQASPSPNPGFILLGGTDSCSSSPFSLYRDTMGYTASSLSP